MQFRKLGHTDIKVSVICLGTMTWAEQNTEPEAFEQLDYALDQDVNFIDTAELYPVPPREKTYTKTESMIGNWFEQRKNRDKVILASKIAGPSAWANWIRGGNSRFDKKNITEALEGSLKRLKTDYIDLYQLHWPERKTNFFGQLGYKVAKEDSFLPFEETLEVLNDFVKQGKIRHVGLSNETPWGVMRFLDEAKRHNSPRMVSIQNPYSLLNRTYEVGLAEISHRENVGLLAYSPLAFGVLSGKYLNNQKPKGARLTLFGNHFSRYTKPRSIEATQAYINLAKELNISPVKLALAFVNSRPFLTSNIIGATSLEQLKENIDSIEVTIDVLIEKKINKIHEMIPNPSP